jgi:hypothetical protein
MKGFTEIQLEKCTSAMEARGLLYDGHEMFRQVFQFAWQDCLESNGIIKDHLVIIGLRNLIWPSWAKSIKIIFSDSTDLHPKTSRSEIIKIVLPPEPEWEPKDGETIWFWKNSDEKYVKFASSESYYKTAGVRIAAIVDFNSEKDQPWEYFVERGKYREAVK